jgi:hypothetical protein
VHALAPGALLVMKNRSGHTTGNQTLFVHTDRGVVGSSESGTCADKLVSAALPHRRRTQGGGSARPRLILNANTPELAAEQYTSMLLERAVVDRVPENPDFFQMFPSSEITQSVLAPHIKPTYPACTWAFSCSWTSQT